MARILVDLRLALSRHAYSRVGGRLLWRAIWPFAGVVGLVVGAFLVLVDFFVGGYSAALGAVTATWFAWIYVPTLLPSLRDGLTDPAALDPYPLSARQKIVGLIAAALAAPTTLGTVVMAAVLAASVGLTWYARPAMLVGAVLLALSCVVSSRVLQSATARVARSRRGSDTSTMVVGLVSLGLYLVYFYALYSTAQVATAQALDPVSMVASWTPPGAAVAWVFDLSAGNLGLMVARLAIAVGWIAAMCGAWVLVLRRQARGGRRRASSRAQAAVPGHTLAPQWATQRWGAIVASAAQMRRYLLFRHPRASLQFASVAMFAVIAAHNLASMAGVAMAAALVGTIGSVALASGVFNFDARGFEYLVIAGAPMRAVVIGKSLIVGGVMVATVAAFCLGEAAWAGAWSEVPVAIVYGMAVVCFGTGLGACVSAFAPVDASQRSSSGGAAALASLAAMGVAMVVVVASAALVNVIRLPDIAEAAAAAIASVAIAVVLVRAAGSYVDSHVLVVARKLAR